MASCISPILVKQQWVPCGLCGFCLSRKRQDWSFRIKQELKRSRSADFITLTYSPEEVPLSPSGLFTLDKSHFQLFMKKLRREHDLIVPRADKWPKMRYYTVGEYGTDTQRPHYHAILFNLHPGVKPATTLLWGRGHIDFGDVTGASIGYVTGYVINRHGEYQDRNPPFALISKGMGSNYVHANFNYHKHGKRFIVNNQGQPGSLPRYYADKIFNKHEREVYRTQLQAEIQDRYQEEINRIRDYHQDPGSYYLEQRAAACEAVKVKATLNHKL